MPRVVIKLTPKQTGGYSARKRIPADVRAEYARLFGNSSEDWFTTPSGVSLADAKQKAQEWSVEVESRIANIRAGRTGEGRTLTKRQALALAGEWYRWFVARHEDEPGAPDGWWWRASNLLEELEDLAPAEVRALPIENWDWLEEPGLQSRARAIVSDEAQTAQFLASQGLVLGRDATALFLDSVRTEFLAAARLLERRAKRDYSPDKRLKTFPKLELERPTSGPSLSPWRLFETWVQERKPAASSVTRWRAVFLGLEKHFEGRSAGSLKEDEARAWAQQLITPERSPATVMEVWLNAARTVFGWGVEQRKIASNPFIGVKVTVPKKTHTRETKAFTEGEALIILKAATVIGDPGESHSAAVRRWVPWLCAYTGARSGEMTQLRGSDVVESVGVPAVRVTPEAGTVKNREPRTIPLHEHLLAQGFLKFAKSKGDGPLFYNPKGIKKSDDPTKPRRPRSVTARQQLASWVRSLGVTDPGVGPNHGWRHTFKLIADRHGITERLSDYITGHKPANVSRTYGKPTLQDMAEALKKFPRYETGERTTAQKKRK